MTAVSMAFGPAAYGHWEEVGASANNYDLNDADDSAAQMLILPQSGSITDVGFWHVATGGTPPDYQASVQTITTTKLPSGSAYGGSAITPFTPGSPGWRWVTLSTPATATAGETIAIKIEPKAGGTAPTASNWISVSISYIGENGVDQLKYFSTAWLSRGNRGPFAVRYSDGTIVGLPVTRFQPMSSTFHLNTTPDEVGGKFTVPFGCTVYGAMFGVSYANNAWPAIFKLYDAANTLLSSFTATTETRLSYNRLSVAFAPITLTKDAVYRLTVVPTSTTATKLGGFTMADTALRYCLPNGLNFCWTQRTDAGSWADDTTKLPYVALLLSDIDFPVASSGGGAYAFAG